MPAETVQLISEGVDMVLDLDPDVIGTDPRNRGAVERLLARVRAKPGIIPFVGAGLSIPYKLSAWRSFLTEIAEDHKNDHPELPNLVRSHLQNQRFEEAAQQIICAVEQEIFNRILEQKFGDDAVKTPNYLTVMDLLPHIANGPVITTNFDHLLEKAFMGAQRAFDLVLWGGKVQAASDVFTEDLHLLLKLHGDVLDDTDRVLTLTEYNSHYGSVNVEHADLSRPLPQILTRLFHTRSLLFLGCSLEGDRYMRLLRRIAANESSLEHFACVPAPAAEGEFKEREEHLRNTT